MDRVGIDLSGVREAIEASCGSPARGNVVSIGAPDLSAEMLAAGFTRPAQVSGALRGIIGFDR